MPRWQEDGPLLDSLFILIQMISLAVLLTWAVRKDSEKD